MLQPGAAVTVCTGCADSGHVCENHPDRPWGGLCCAAPDGPDVCEHGACQCGAGAPCPTCCTAPPQDGTGSSVVEAFAVRRAPPWSGCA